MPPSRVGRSAGPPLRSRVASYWLELRGRGHLGPMVARVALVEAVCCDSAHEAAWLERNLLEVLLPPFNRTPGGEELPSTSGWMPGRCTPAYRSPTRQGRAASALIWPLPGWPESPATARRVAPDPSLPEPPGAWLGGAERDLAGRAVPPIGGGRPALARLAFTAVLERQPAAVAGGTCNWSSCANRAAQALAYEPAARIQAEIGAPRWVSCPQRVTTMDAANLSIAGWAGGVLVQFQIRGGRLCTWSQRPCSHSSATDALAATPAAWRGFTQRNAELATPPAVIQP